jgi:hypothetical protein
MSTPLYLLAIIGFFIVAVVVVGGRSQRRADELRRAEDPWQR